MHITVKINFSHVNLSNFNMYFQSLLQIFNMMDTQELEKNIRNMFPARLVHKSDYSENIAVKTLPLIGRVHFVKDTNGIMQVSLIFAYWVYGTFSTLFIILLPQYHDGRVPAFIIYSESLLYSPR